MYIERIPNRNSRPTILIRESHREGGKVRKKTVGNLTGLPEDQIEMIRQVLKGVLLVPAESLFEVKESLPHGHVELVLGYMKKLQIDRLVGWDRSRERDLVIAMIAQRILYSGSKLEDTRLWHACTLAEELDIADADENDLYVAMDWLLQRQQRIEKKLAGRHLSEDDSVFYDVSSSYYEGEKCPLACYGYDRDGKKGKKIIVYGMMTDAAGRPVAAQVYPGNTQDSTTVIDQVETLRNRFDLEKVILVGDRGMITQTRIEDLKAYPGIGWISALKSQDVRKLVNSGQLQLSLFNNKDLAEISSPEFPDERLVACYNPALSDERSKTREALLAKTEEALVKIENEVRRRSKKPLSADEIGVKLGRVFSKWKMGKHFKTVVEDGSFQWERDEISIGKEAAMDGIYVIRAGKTSSELSSPDLVRQYKNLGRVEEVFRTMKGIDIMVRPIRHRLENRVRAHVFICMLAYYVVWHMKKDLASILFHDETIDDVRPVRDAVKKAMPTANAKKKKVTKKDAEGNVLHSFNTLIEAMKTRCRNKCCVKKNGVEIPITQHTQPSPFHQRVFNLCGIGVGM